jgi:hypothetical protein
MNITIWRLIAGGLRSLVLQPPVGTGGTVLLAIAIQSAWYHRPWLVNRLPHSAHRVMQ